MTGLLDHVPTRKEYDSASPYMQGYMEYGYSEWPKSQIPKGCPYPYGSEGREEFQRGQLAAMLDAQDFDE